MSEDQIPTPNSEWEVYTLFVVEIILFGIIQTEKNNWDAIPMNTFRL